MRHTMNNIACLGFLSLLACTACQKSSKDKDAVKTSYVHQYGVEIADEKEWQERGSSGRMVQKLINGSTVVKTWQEGALQGLSYTTFPHTDIICQETFYEAGEPLWMAKNYQSGAPCHKEQYLPGQCTVITTWYQDGSLRSNEEYKEKRLHTAQYYNTEQTVESSVLEGAGDSIIRDGYGQLIARKTIQQGQVASEELFYSNGIPKQKIPYVNGSVEGIVKTFYPGGEPKTVEEWQDGKLNGLVTQFENGEIVGIIPYVEGEKEGVEQRFRPGTSELVQEISWKHNVRHGPAISYVDEEKITEWYHDGRKVSKMHFIELEHARKPF